jgi:hypothetical protein
VQRRTRARRDEDGGATSHDGKDDGAGRRFGAEERERRDRTYVIVSPFHITNAGFHLLF